MSKRIDGRARGKYTLEFKLEAVRLVNGGRSVPVTAKVPGVSASGYFEHWQRKDSTKSATPEWEKHISDQVLLVHVRAIHAEVKQEYGWPKMWKELLTRCIRVSKERVRKLMQRHGIKARSKRKFVCHH